MVLRSRLAGLIASLVLATALFAGCGTTLVLDNARLQHEIESGLQNNGITATVTCSGEQPIRQGQVSRCQAVTEDGLTLTIEVTQTDDNGNVNWQVVGS